jgi:hypothetical protein
MDPTAGPWDVPLYRSCGIVANVAVKWELQYVLSTG